MSDQPTLRQLWKEAAWTEFCTVSPDGDNDEMAVQEVVDLTIENVLDAMDLVPERTVGWADE